MLLRWHLCIEKGLLVVIVTTKHVPHHNVQQFKYCYLYFKMSESHLNKMIGYPNCSTCNGHQGGITNRLRSNTEIHDRACRLVAITGTTILVPSRPCQVIETLLNRKPKVNRCPSELQWFELKIGQQDSSPSIGHQGDMPHSAECCRWLIGDRLYYSGPLFTKRQDVLQQDLVKCRSREIRV